MQTFVEDIGISGDTNAIAILVSAVVSVPCDPCFSLAWVFFHSCVSILPHLFHPVSPASVLSWSCLSRLDHCPDVFSALLSRSCTLNPVSFPSCASSPLGPLNPAWSVSHQTDYIQACLRLSPTIQSHSPTGAESCRPLRDRLGDAFRPSCSKPCRPVLVRPYPSRSRPFRPTCAWSSREYLPIRLASDG